MGSGLGFSKGDRVVWTYRINPVCRKTKKGTYRGACKHTSKHWSHRSAEQMAWVEFDGNKRISKVPLYDLRAIADFCERLTDEGKK